MLIPTLRQSRTLPGSGTSSRSASRSASTAQFYVPAAVSPILDDLQKFPAESLHSFSFARQSEDFLHSRHAIIQRSAEFIRDYRNNPGLAIAQAKLSGDTEIQGMMDLLRRAKVMPSLDIRAANAQGVGLGPMTGPAFLHGDNVFETSFFQNDTAQAERTKDTVPDGPYVSESAILSDTDLPTPALRLDSSPTRRRPGLKRTYTDVKMQSLKQTLIDTLARPYSSDNIPLSQEENNASFLASIGTSISTNAPSLHNHSTKWTPPAQAFFRTENDTPWTIMAANDVACLTFGVTRAEMKSLSILGLIQQDRRQWLEDKIRLPEPIKDPPRSPGSPDAAPVKTSVLASKGGITARLLSKAPSRLASVEKKSENAGISNVEVKFKTVEMPKSRGVLLCGEILPIQKRDGRIGAASFWVQEKQGGLIWIVEEVIEDVAYLEYDTSRRLVSSRGDVENIWTEPLRTGIKLRYLIPHLSFEDLDNVIYDGEPLLGAGFYTASTTGGVNVPATIAKVKDKLEIRVSSLPHTAGMIVINPDTLNISSSNAIFAQTLFGQKQPNGMNIDDLIPGFTDILDFLTEVDDHALVDGLVIPEHSFRRARALLALRDGNEDAANLFLRPAGLPARHRDGSEIMVDVQMRVVHSETVFPTTTEDVIVEEGVENPPSQAIAISEVVYALWVTYSRQLHSAGMGVSRPDHPLASRPATPPSQPMPRDEVPSPPQLTTSSTESSISRRDASPAEPMAHPLFDTAGTTKGQKSINDFVILESMGSGAYGDVKLARYQTSRSSKVVIKYVTKRKILVDTWTRDRKLGTVPLEIHVLDFLRRPGYRHPNIVEMVDFFEDDVNYYIEMLPHGLPGMDLFDYIELRLNMTELECVQIFSQVVSAISHLHISCGIVHRDIKDENVVLDGDNRVKLIDFGSAAYVKNGPFDVFVGTIDYAAPEVLQGRSYGGTQQDVWAMGILLYTMVFRENPFYNIDEILDLPLRLPQLEEPYSPDCIELIRGMLNRDVEQRLTIGEVEKHAWFELERDDAE